MSGTETWDFSTPNPARVYDFWLGGGLNFEHDRKLATAAEETFPGVVPACRANRGFLRRAVEFGLQRGIRQFLDLGCGLPTVGNVHEIAQRASPEATVVYVDNDPLTVAQTASMLRDRPNIAVIRGDARSPQSILDTIRIRALLGMDQPVMVLMLALLHFIRTEDHPEECVRQIRNALPAGSALAISHVTDAIRPAEVRDLRTVFTESRIGGSARSPEWISDLFVDIEWELVPPGPVFVHRWRPEEAGVESPNDLFFGGVAVKSVSGATATAST